MPPRSDRTTIVPSDPEVFGAAFQNVSPPADRPEIGHAPVTDTTHEYILKASETHAPNR